MNHGRIENLFLQPYCPFCCTSLSPMNFRFERDRFLPKGRAVAWRYTIFRCVFSLSPKFNDVLVLPT